MTEAARKFFFIHVMKTAGGTLRRHLEANFAPDEVYPRRKLDPDLLAANTQISYLTGLSPQRLERIRVFTGHFPFVAVELLEVDAITFTMLRDPVERTLSYLRAAKRMREKRRDKSLEEIYDDPVEFLGLIRDHQTKMFSMTAADEPRTYMDIIEIDAERLALAKENLERLDAFGLQDRFEEFQATLAARFGWRFGRVHDWKGRDKVMPDVSVSFRRRIAEDSPADMEFYEHARRLYDSRRPKRTVVDIARSMRRHADAQGFGQEPYFFIHVMKTGGGTVRRHIRANFKGREVWPFQREDPDARARRSIDYLAALPPSRRREIRAYIGHFPFCALEMAGIEATTLTLLRDPVERTISYLRWRQQRDQRPLEEIYEDPFLFPALIHNHQSKLFSLTPADEPGSLLKRLDEPRPDLALANLRRVDVVGVQERMSDFLAELAERFGWRLGAVEDVHVSNGGRDVPASLRHRIAEDNELDIEFYEEARRLCDSRRGVRGVA